jgi:hypothetical protein
MTDYTDCRSNPTSAWRPFLPVRRQVRDRLASPHRTS